MFHQIRTILAVCAMYFGLRFRRFNYCSPLKPLFNNLQNQVANTNVIILHNNSFAVRTMIRYISFPCPSLVVLVVGNYCRFYQSCLYLPEHVWGRSYPVATVISRTRRILNMSRCGTASIIIATFGSLDNVLTWIFSLTSIYNGQRAILPGVKVRNPLYLEIDFCLLSANVFHDN